MEIPLTCRCFQGASSGIGLELARVFAENGFDLLVTSGSNKIERAPNGLRDSGVEVTWRPMTEWRNSGQQVECDFYRSSRQARAERHGRARLRQSIDHFFHCRNYANAVGSGVWATKAFGLSFAQSLRHELKETPVSL
jgi:hypothetical protein